MLKNRITKTLSLDEEVVRAVEKIALRERRSFTRQIELILEKALAKKIPKTQAADSD